MAETTNEGAAKAARTHDEHPDDSKTREDGEAYGTAHGAEFAALSPEMLAQLIGTYSDHDAHELLDVLRERFWLRAWETEKRKRKR